MFSCKTCTKNFKSKFSLERHYNCCKGIPIITEFRCDHCLKYYTTKQNLNVHKEICKSKSSKEELIEVKLKLKEQEIRFLKEQLKAKPKVTNIINNITTTNKTVNKYILLYGMEPLDLSQKRFDNIVEDRYTYEAHIKTKLIPDIILKFLSNDKDKVVGLLTDDNRMKIKCIDDKLKIQTLDPNSFITLCNESKPMKKKHKEFIDIGADDYEYKEERERSDTLKSTPSVLLSSMKGYKHKFLQKNNKSKTLQVEDDNETNIIFVED
jgi:hypothetical protein